MSQPRHRSTGNSWNSGQQVDSSAEGGKFEKITVPAPGDESLHLPEIRGALRKPTRKTRKDPSDGKTLNTAAKTTSPIGVAVTDAMINFRNVQADGPVR